MMGKELYSIDIDDCFDYIKSKGLSDDFSNWIMKKPTTERIKKCLIVYIVKKTYV